MIEYPVTLWHCDIGLGDGQSMASRGYVKALMAVDYKHVVIAPQGLGVQNILNPELQDLQDVIGYPRHLSPVLKRIEEGDPRVGKKWAHIEGDEIVSDFVPGHAPEGHQPMRWKNIVTVGEVDQEYYLAHPEERAVQFTAKTELVVIHYDPGQLARARNTIAQLSEGTAKTVGITAWETNKIPATIAQQLSDLDLLIVPSEHTMIAFRVSGLDRECPIRVIPHALDMAPITQAEFDAAVYNQRLRYIFYTIGTNIPRKNLATLIAAYCKAFGPKFEGVGLTIKTAGDPPSLKKLYKAGVELAGNRYWPKIAIIPDRWPASKIRQLHLQSNCWVDATRGEGFGLGVRDAAAMGNPVITTGWGAQTEVLDQTGVQRTFVGYDLQNIDPQMAEIGVYQEDQLWAEPHIDELVDAMRQAAMERRSKSLAQANRIAEAYSLKRIGRLLADALNGAKQ